MRPVDLARAAGVSTQQVRNLEASGALPEAERSASGYRRYDELHLAALLAYQALAAGMGSNDARALLAAPSENPGGTEDEAAAVAGDILASLDLKPEVVRGDAGRPSQNTAR